VELCKRSAEADPESITRVLTLPPDLLSPVSPRNLSQNSPKTPPSKRSRSASFGLFVQVEREAAFSALVRQPGGCEGSSQAAIKGQPAPVGPLDHLGRRASVSRADRDARPRTRAPQERRCARRFRGSARCSDSAYVLRWLHRSRCTRRAKTGFPSVACSAPYGDMSPPTAIAPRSSICRLSRAVLTGPDGAWAGTSPTRMPPTDGAGSPPLPLPHASPCSRPGCHRDGGALDSVRPERYALPIARPEQQRSKRGDRSDGRCVVGRSASDPNSKPGSGPGGLGPGGDRAEVGPTK
jgi:hypothetical protein